MEQRDCPEPRPGAHQARVSPHVRPLGYSYPRRAHGGVGPIEARARPPLRPHRTDWSAFRVCDARFAVRGFEGSLRRNGASSGLPGGMCPGCASAGMGPRGFKTATQAGGATPACLVRPSGGWPVRARQAGPQPLPLPASRAPVKFPKQRGGQGARLAGCRPSRGLCLPSARARDIRRPERSRRAGPGCPGGRWRRAGPCQAPEAASDSRERWDSGTTSSW